MQSKIELLPTESQAMLSIIHSIISVSIKNVSAEQILKQLVIFAFASTNNRCQDHYALALGKYKNVLNDLLNTLAGDRCAADVAMRNANGREEQPHVVIDFSYRPNRGTRTS